MVAIQWVALALIAAFYVAYFTKMILQHHGDCRKWFAAVPVVVIDLF